MKLTAECSDCNKIFDLEIDDSNEDKRINEVLNEKFGDKGILCVDCERYL